MPVRTDTSGGEMEKRNVCGRVLVRSGQAETEAGPEEESLTVGMVTTSLGSIWLWQIEMMPHYRLR